MWQGEDATLKAKAKASSETESVAEAAAGMGIDARTVRKLWTEGRLRGFSTGHGLRISRRSVDALINGTFSAES